MALPTKSASWTYSVCNRIVYTSVVQVARETMYLIKQRLKTVGYTVRGSSNGTTGAMDGVDRWASATDAGIRANSAVTPISWIVLTDANGYDVCFAYNAATDDVYRISVSLETPFVAAATPTWQPTSTTELTLNTFYTSTPGTIVNAATSLDRLVSVWTRSDIKGFRVGIARNNAWVSIFGMDLHTPVSYAAGITVAPASAFYGNAPGSWAVTAANSPLGDSNAVSATATTQWRYVGRRSTAANLVFSKTAEAVGGATANGPTVYTGLDYAPELQGGAEYPIRRLGIYSTTTSHRGKVGNLIDMWMGRTTGVDGDVYGNREFIVMSASHGLMWPWDGTSSVAGTAVVMA